MERIISEKVVSERIIKSNNSIPIIGGIFGKFSKFGASIQGLCMAPFIIMIAFGVIIYSENFHKSSKIVENLEVISAQDASDKKGLQKIQGEPIFTKKVSAPAVGEVLYFEYSKEKYKEVEEKETETITTVENGQEIEKVVERTKLVEKWVEEETKKEWSDFKLGSITIDPKKAAIKFDFTSKQFLQSQLGGYTVYSDSYTPRLNDTRINVRYVSTSEEIIVIGEISSMKIASGDEFIISNFSDAELLETLKGEENTLYWGLKFVSFVLLFIGFTSILGPIVALADFIPFAGKIASTIASIFSLIIALVFVVVITLFVKFWWLILLCGVGFFAILMGLLAVIVVQKSSKAEKK